jgi:surfeit locus 1 family protein
MSKQDLWLPTLMTLLGIAILCALGAWQMHRLSWKEDLLRQMDAELSKDASQILLDSDDFRGEDDLKRGSVRGTYDFEKQILIGPRTFNNLPGRHVYTPLRLEDGTYILINRGWVPTDWTSAHETPEARDAAQRNAQGGIIGMLRRKWDGSPFTPDNKPEADKWYKPDTQAVAKAKNIPTLHDALFMLEGTETEGDYPIAVSTKATPPNNHLQYAIFWFTMAGILAVIFVLRFLKK